MTHVQDAGRLVLALAGLALLLLVCPFVALACAALDAIDRPTPEEVARRRWRYG